MVAGDARPMEELKELKRAAQYSSSVGSKVQSFFAQVCPACNKRNNLERGGTLDVWPDPNSRDEAGGHLGGRRSHQVNRRGKSMFLGFARSLSQCSPHLGLNWRLFEWSVAS